MLLSINLPAWMPLAFAVNGSVETVGISGAIHRRPLADIVLPTGKIGCGYPDTESGIDEPSKVFPQVPPGHYPVFITTASDGQYRSFAFLTVQFDSAPPTFWNPAGGFFTDGGNGLVYDTCLAEGIQQYRIHDDESWRLWSEIQSGTLLEGDGNLIVDSNTGANAILFRTHDFGYPIYTGHDESGKIVCLVVDGHIEY